MTGQRAALTFLLLAEAAAFGYMSETVVFPAAIAVAALFGCRGVRLYRASHDRQVILGLVAFLLFIVKWRVQPYSQFEETMEYFSPFLHTLGQFLLVLQTAALYLVHDRGLLPLNMPWAGVFVMVAAGDVTVSPTQRFAFQLFSLGFVAATALYFAETARAGAGIQNRSYGSGKVLVSVAVLLLVAGVAWAASTGLHRYEHTLDRLVAELLNPDTGSAGAGFPSRSRLGSIARRKSERANDVALRVYAAEPGYFRGKAYHWLKSVHGPGGVTTQWEEAPDPGDGSLEGKAEVVTPFARIGGRMRYALRGRPTAEPSARERLDVWIDSPQDVYFLPPLASEIVTTEQALRRDYRYVTSGTDAGVVNYVVQVGPPPDPAPFFDLEASSGPFSREALTDIPPSVAADAELLRRAEELFAGCRSVQDHVTRVEDYFRANFGYAIGIDPPADEDPVRWFLRTRPKAHCEYFAQAAALLLRIRGVPTRYMTGFVVAERNEYGGYWLARNEHAHAWCEAWDDRLGWVVVEATPPAGVPSEAAASWHRQLWEYLSTAVAEFRHRFAEGGWRWLLAQALAFFASPAGWAALALVAAYIALRLRMRRRAAPRPLPPAVAEMHRLLARMDRRLAKAGLTRGPGETLDRFANRVESKTGDAAAATWYADYAAVRYGGPADEAAVISLRTRLRTLGPPPRKSARETASVG